jgi:Cof subfamily protein (haloacid dehalogenase superfamily)
MPEVRMIVLDLDGTVLHSDTSISPYTLEVLEKCRKNGIKIAVATARSEAAAKRFLQQLKPEAIISNGGALVTYRGEKIHRCMLSSETVNGIIRECKSSPDFLSITVQSDSGYYVTWEHPESGDYSHAVHNDFLEPFQEEAYKITAEMGSGEALGSLEKKYPECRVLVFTGENWYRIAHKNAGKMEAVQKIGEKLQILPAQIAAFGDDLIDMDMLQGCGIGVAMGNASREVQAQADFICDTNDRDGVAKWLEEFVLRK